MPQLSLSVSTFRHVPAQLCVPLGHSQVPPWHVLPPLHSLVPQQFPAGMHVPLQSFWPVGQEQVPLWQVAPPPQLASVQHLACGMHLPRQGLRPLLHLH